MAKLVWYSYSKDLLPDSLLAASPFNSLGGNLVKGPTSGTHEVTIGYFEEGRAKDLALPSIIVLPDKASAEIFAWLKAYAPDTSPLSQFSRIIANKEFKSYHVAFPPKIGALNLVQRWPSLILGEIFAQGEVDTNIDSLPLSRCLASYSNTMARASIIHNDKMLYETCVERLKVAEADRRFVSRILKIDDLKPIWDSIDIHWDSEGPITKVIEIFGGSLEVEKDLFDRSDKRSSLHNYPELLSDSVEARVVAFRALLRDKMASLDVPELRAHLSATFATAAFLVGRSTSHIFLLKGIDRVIPSVYVWFGLIAGMVGPRYWDVEWTRAAKGVEKNLRAKLDWSEPNQSDLSWSEYEWLTETYRNASPFIELPKQLPKVLSVEVLPGAACQFRLVLEASSIGKNVQAETDARENNILKNLLVELQSLTEKTKAHLYENERYRHYIDDYDKGYLKRGRNKTSYTGDSKK
ncbi:hypothetical protein SON66_11855 [Pseudomonas syringae]|uniref:hypothetical protein n=1 Tax=Pseudomonas syringae TaxID=317 RepID=UPI00040BA2B6|nr:hypothetical protein [Pseudomonas syringae]MDY2563963.1 hypothetical protein [Pseudomonas syringae]